MKNSKDLSKIVYDYVSISDLIPYANNANQHSEAQVTLLASSIKHFGFINPIIIDKDCGVIAGHGRLLAAQKLKMTLVPCLRVEHLTPSQKRAYILMDNESAKKSTYNEEMLAIELTALKEENFDALLTGFGQEEIDKILGEGFEPNLSDDDEEDEAEEEKKFILTVSLENELEQENLFKYLNSKGYKVKAK